MEIEAHPRLVTTPPFPSESFVEESQSEDFEATEY